MAVCAVKGMGITMGQNKRTEGGGVKRWAKSRQGQKWIMVFTFLLIPLLLLFVFTYLPFAKMVQFSFYEMSYLGDRTFIGLGNYKEVFSRPEYFATLRISVYYFAGAFVQMALALFFAMLLSFQLKGRNFFKGVLFFPYLINGVAIGFVFLYFFKRMGTLDTLLTMAGVPEDKLPYWLLNRNVNNISLSFVSVWRYMGQNLIMFIGAIQSLDHTVYEASDIDGANRWQQFCYIILPGIKTVVSLNLILAVRGAISVFEIPYIITNGSNGTATFVIQTIQTAFKFKKVGLASAMAVVLLVLILIITAIQEHYFNRRDRSK
ncbi:carbohydrate ABC transporter permease [Anaerotaenia torta]|uniref:carbohydrate ABC transporter permease n=1 Tax=Anaerotaenia torta TaxID=433293 RepID=UPI003D218D66